MAAFRSACICNSIDRCYILRLWHGSIHPDLSLRIQKAVHTFLILLIERRLNSYLYQTNYQTKRDLPGIYLKAGKYCCHKFWIDILKGFVSNKKGFPQEVPNEFPILMNVNVKVIHALIKSDPPALA